MRGTPSYIGPFTGGLNTRDSVMELPYTHSPDLLNVIGGKEGTVRKRDACSSMVTSFAAAGVNDVASLFYSETQDKFICAVGAKFYSATTNNITADITGAFVPVVGVKWCFVDAVASGGQGPVYFCSNDGPPTNGYWAGGAGTTQIWTASSGTLPPGDFMVYYKNRIIMGGRSVGTNGCGIAASAVGDPRNWDTTVLGSSSSWLTNIDPNDGFSFTGLGVVGAYVIAFKDNKTYIIYDTDTGANRLLSNSVGLSISNFRTISQTPYGLTWLAQDGHVYSTDGVKIEKLSDIIDSASSGFAAGISTQPTLGFPARISSTPAAAGYFGDRYYLSMAYNNVTQFSFCYDFITKTWWRFTGFFYQYANFSSSKQTSGGLAGGMGHITGTQAPIIQALYLPGLSNTDGSSWKDGGVTYNAYYCTPALASSGKGNNNNLRKRFHAMRGFIAGTVDIQTASDVLGSNPPTFTTIQSLTTRPVDFPVETSIYSLGVSNNIQFKFTSTDGFAWELHPFQVYTQPRTD